ncbi:hypothetical protein AAMO2058_001513600 [Amorphochlora amoebiformis]
MFPLRGAPVSRVAILIICFLLLFQILANYLIQVSPSPVTVHWARIEPFPAVNIRKGHTVSIGHSHAGDFAHQLHIAFSSIINGTCGFHAQPYNCAVLRFELDRLVPQSNESHVPYCKGCPTGKTITYDHCKSHPEWVDVEKLEENLRNTPKCIPSKAMSKPLVMSELTPKPNQENPKGTDADFARQGASNARSNDMLNASMCIDPPDNLKDQRVFLFRGAKDPTYRKGSVRNTRDLYARFMVDPDEQIKLVNSLPFDHTLPTPAHGYDGDNSKPVGYDGPRECLSHVFPGVLTNPPITPNHDHECSFPQDPFIDSDMKDIGIYTHGYMYAPNECLKCNPNAIPEGCPMLVLADHCDLKSDSGTWWTRWAASNNIVVLKPCIANDLRGFVDLGKYPFALEPFRGLLDVYGQTGLNYASQSGVHMKFVGRLVKHIQNGNGYTSGRRCSIMRIPWLKGQFARVLLLGVIGLLIIAVSVVAAFWIYLRTVSESRFKSESKSKSEHSDALHVREASGKASASIQLDHRGTNSKHNSKDG